MEGFKELTKKDLEKLDIIEITTEQFDKTQDWLHANYSKICENYNEIKNIFNEVIITFTKNKKNMKTIHIQKDFIHVYDDERVYLCGKQIPSLDILKEMYFKNYDYAKYNPTEQYFFNEHIPLNNIDENGNTIRDIAVEELMDVLASYFELLIYINFNQEHVTRQTRTHTKKFKSKKINNKGKKNKTKLIKQNIIRLNTDHIKTPTEEDKRNYERHTLGWTVRGHWRTYKSGKKTWIKPSVRGDKDKVTGKIYEV